MKIINLPKYIGIKIKLYFVSKAKKREIAKLQFEDAALMRDKEKELLRKLEELKGKK